jgi:hypothetical protein
MKKGVVLLLPMLACASASPMDWKLPVITVKYDIARSTVSDTDADEELLIPASLGNIVSLHVKESGDPVDLGLTLKYSAKDYLLQIGDYSYFTLDQETKIKVSDSLDLGFTMGGKWLSAPEPYLSGIPKDYFSMKARAEAALDLFKGSTLDMSLAAQYDLNNAEAKRRQLYTTTAGLSYRLGEMLMSVKYRGEFRFPLGGMSIVETRALNEGSLSLQWDLNR